MNTDVAEYPRDVNGVPIKPGYRKPFTSETARLYNPKAQATQAAKRQAKALALGLPKLPASTARELETKLASLRRMQRRAIAQATAENDAKKQSLFMRSFTAAFDAEQSLLGNSTKARKPSAAPTIAPVAPTTTAKVDPVVESAPQPVVNCGPQSDPPAV